MPDIDWLRLHGQTFADQRVLVTGGAGFIGSHLCAALAQLGAQVVVIDDLTGGDEANIAALPENLQSAITLKTGSILDRDLLNDCITDCRWVFHQAALGSVPRSVREPDLFTQVNIVGTQQVLEAARTAKVERVMFAASSSAYGDTPTLPKHEGQVPRPQSPYAATKTAGESLMRAYAHSYGLDTASLRYFNIFGPRQNANSAYAAVIAAFAKALHNDEQPVIYGDGEQTRDFTFVANAVHANLLAARSETPIQGEAFNVACGQRISVNQLATEMARIMGKAHLTPQYEPDRPGDVRDSLADLTKIKDLIGYDPIIAFEAGLADTIAWYEQAFAAM